MNIKSLLIAAASTAGILTLSNPASAIIYDWQFTNEDGAIGSPTDVISGFVEFNDADVFPGATDVGAINLQLTNVPGFPDGSPPFDGDGGIELFENLLDRNRDGVSSVSSIGTPNFGGDFDFDSNLMLSDYNIALVITDDELRDEFLRLRSSGSSLLNLKGVDRFEDSDSSSASFQEASASVPFEFSPTLGLFLAGSIFAGRSYIKRRQARTFIENK